MRSGCGVAAMNACQCASMRPGISTRPFAAITRTSAFVSTVIGLDRDALNGVASDQHIGRRRERGALAVEDADVLKQRDRAAGGSDGERCQTRRSEVRIAYLRQAPLAKRDQECRQHQPSLQPAFQVRGRRLAE